MALQKWVGISALVMVPVTLAIAVRQVFQGPMLDADGVTIGENYSYSATFMVLAVIGLWQGITRGLAPLRLAGLGLLTLVTIKVFLIDASALEGLLRILSFLGLGGALIGIGWGYGRMQRASAEEGRG